MAIMADVARNPAFAKEELERQRSQALDALSVAYQSPGQLAGFATSPVLFSGTPFGQSAVGHARDPRQDLDGRSGEAARQTYSRPDNAILVLTGDIEPQAGFALAEKAFGDWKAPAGPSPARAAIAPKAAPRAIAIDLPGTGQAAVTVAKAAIPARRPVLLSGDRHQLGAGRRLFRPPEPGDPHQARPLLRRQLRPDRHAHHRPLPRFGPDQERVGAGGAGP